MTSTEFWNFLIPSPSLSTKFSYFSTPSPFCVDVDVIYGRPLPSFIALSEKDRIASHLPLSFVPYVTSTFLIVGGGGADPHNNLCTARHRVPPRTPLARTWLNAIALMRINDYSPLEEVGYFLCLWRSRPSRDACLSGKNGVSKRPYKRPYRPATFRNKRGSIWDH